MSPQDRYAYRVAQAQEHAHDERRAQRRLWWMRFEIEHGGYRDDTGTLANRRYDFARWLYEHGRIGEFEYPVMRDALHEQTDTGEHDGCTEETH